VIALRMVERDLKVFAKLWHAFAFTTFVMPALFLLAMGLGLGGLVDDRPGTVDGLTYLHFVAPGLLMAAVMQQAAGESLWPVLGGVKWDHRYDAMVATPATAVDVYVAVLAFIAIRTVLSTAAFLLVAAVLGALVSPWAVLALPIAVLCALAFGAPLCAYAVTRESDVPFALIMRLGVQPLFLFSGTFFPVENLPGWAERLSWLSPLWHGVELARHATTAQAHWGADAVHLVLLLAVIAVGFAAGTRTFPRRLTP
jgi:lipooligosaccharide transport system permease protein